MRAPKRYIAGVDEVGRGSLFGPVFAGLVILDKNGETQLLSAGLKDSKLLSSKKRANLTPLIKEISLAWSLGQASSKEIDSVGIRLATERAMVRAIQRIRLPIKLLLVDGLLPISIWQGPQKNLVHGENHSPAIAAASVLAKESRDELIKRLALKFPGYALDKNVGYGTNAHRQALRQAGPTKLHRNSFLSRIID